jgi:hypothetical protein
MSDTSSVGLLNDLLDPLSRCLDEDSARRVAELRIGSALEEKIRVLAEKANDGLLNEDERADYEAIINTADIISILKLKAQHQLKSNGT